MNYLNNYLKKIFDIIRTNKEDIFQGGNKEVTNKEVIQIFYDQRILQFRA